MKTQVLSLILISVLIIVLPALSVGQSSEGLHLDSDRIYETLNLTSNHHNADGMGASQHENHHCCHSHTQVVPITSRQYLTQVHPDHKPAPIEYSFIIVAHESFPDFRPPIA